MKVRATALAAAAALAACGQEPAPALAQAAPALDCAKGFEALNAALNANPALQRAPAVAGEPYTVLNARDGSSSYLVTQPGAPGHPAIVKQEPARDPQGRLSMRNTGCPFGDEAGYDELIAYLETLSRAAQPAAK